MLPRSSGEIRHKTNSPHWGSLVVVVVVCIGASPISAVGNNVAVIDTEVFQPNFLAQYWCNLLQGAGYQCVVFPSTGPEGSLETFDVVATLSSVWTDPDGLLAEVMRDGRGVITWSRAPRALGIDDNPTVQAWIGANMASAGDAELITVATDPILGPRTVGTVLGHAGASARPAINDTTGHPDAKMLARYIAGGSIGVLRNRWEGGQSVYFSEDTFGRPGSEDILLNAVRELAGPPDPAVPAVSQWGLVVLSLLVLTAGSIVLSRRLRAATQAE